MSTASLLYICYGYTHCVNFGDVGTVLLTVLDGGGSDKGRQNPASTRSPSTEQGMVGQYQEISRKTTGHAGDQYFALYMPFLGTSS